MLKEVFLHLKNTQIWVKYKNEVTELNADTLGLFLIFGIILSVGSILVQLISIGLEGIISNCIMLAYFLICLLWYKKHIRDHVDFSILYLYLVQLPVLILAILMGTMLDPLTPAFTVHLILLALPAFILDKPQRIYSYIIGSALLFVYFACRYKTGTVLSHDLLHISASCMSSLILSTWSLDNRIISVERSQHFLLDSEHDPLTGIYNRRGGEEKISNLIHDGVGGLFLIMDIDNFKHVNDTYGHSMGDEVLSAVSVTLSSSFRSSDIVMRMGGDEFIVYAPGLVNYYFINIKMGQINDKMREITCTEGKDNISVSIGAVINDGSYPDYESIFHEADALLYETKSHGKNSFRLQSKPYSLVESTDAKSDDYKKAEVHQSKKDAMEKQAEALHERETLKEH